MKKIVIAIACFSMMACNNSNSSNQQREIDSLKTEALRQHITDSVMQAQAAIQNTVPIQEYPTVTTPVAAAPGTTTPAHAHHTSYHHSTNSGTSATPGTTTTTTTTTTEPQKKGWSNKAKGALIGAGAGALTGAVVDHNNRGAGALIGGLAGAALGTGTGAIIDAKKKKQTTTTTTTTTTNK